MDSNSWGLVWAAQVGRVGRGEPCEDGLSLWLGVLCFCPCRCRGIRSTAAPSSAMCTARPPARISAMTACPSPAMSTTTTSAPWIPVSSLWWPSVRAAVPSSSFPSSRWAPQGQLAFESVSRGCRRDRLSRDLGGRGCSIHAVVQMAKWQKRPQLL